MRNVHVIEQKVILNIWSVYTLCDNILGESDAALLPQKTTTHGDGGVG